MLINSSATWQAEYDAAPPELYIWFTDNERPYGYRAVPHEIFDELCDARSHGRFFADQIRDRYEIIPPP